MSFYSSASTQHNLERATSDNPIWPNERTPSRCLHIPSDYRSGWLHANRTAIGILALRRRLSMAIHHAIGGHCMCSGSVRLHAVGGQGQLHHVIPHGALHTRSIGAHNLHPKIFQVAIDLCAKFHQRQLLGVSNTVQRNYRLPFFSRNDWLNQFFYASKVLRDSCNLSRAYLPHLGSIKWGEPTRAIVSSADNNRAMLMYSQYILQFPYSKSYFVVFYVLSSATL